MLQIVRNWSGTGLNSDFRTALQCIVQRYKVSHMGTRATDTTSNGRNSGVAFLVLTSLADGEKHGYALTKDIESFAGVHVAPGSMYESLARLEAPGLIEPVASDDRRRPYRLTAAGAQVLSDHVRAQERLVAESRRRLRRGWSLT